MPIPVVVQFTGAARPTTKRRTGSDATDPDRSVGVAIGFLAAR